MDNAILIIAGDYIDTNLGVTLGISTLCAAAIGNVFSDLAGIGCAASIEDFCATTLKLPVPRLSSAQRQLRSVRMYSQGGMAIGMTFGCLLGMIPLLYIDSNKADRMREKARLKSLCKDVLNEAKTLINAESTCLFLRVDKDETPNNSNNNGTKAQPWRRGIGILPGYHPSVNGEYLYAMYYVEPDQYRHTRSSTTDNLMRKVSGGSQGTQRSSNGGYGDGDGSGDDGKKNSAVTVSDGKFIKTDDAVIRGPHASPSASELHSTRIIPIGKGIVSRAVQSGTTWNIVGNLMDEPDFYPLSIETAGGSKNVDRENFRDKAVVPVLDCKGRVIGVLEALNKERPGVGDIDNLDNTGGFTDEDVEVLMSLASHVSVSLHQIYRDGEEDEEVELQDTIRILREGKSIKRSVSRKVPDPCDRNDTRARSSQSSDRDPGANSDITTSIINTPSTAGRNKIHLFPE